MNPTLVTKLEIKKNMPNIVISVSKKLLLPKLKADSKNLGNRPIIKEVIIGKIQTEHSSQIEFEPNCGLRRPKIAKINIENH